MRRPRSASCVNASSRSSHAPPPPPPPPRRHEPEARPGARLEGASNIPPPFGASHGWETKRARGETGREAAAPRGGDEERVRRPGADAGRRVRFAGARVHVREMLFPPPFSSFPPQPYSAVVGPGDERLERARVRGCAPENRRAGGQPGKQHGASRPLLGASSLYPPVRGPLSPNPSDGVTSPRGPSRRGDHAVGGLWPRAETRGIAEGALRPRSPGLLSRLRLDSRCEGAVSGSFSPSRGGSERTQGCRVLVGARGSSTPPAVKLFTAG